MREAVGRHPMLVLARGVILDHALAVWARPRVVIPVLAVPVFASAAWLVTGLSRRLSCILLAIFFTWFFLSARPDAASTPSPPAFSSGPAGPRLSSRLSSLLDMAHLRQRQDREHEDPEDGVKDKSIFIYI